MTFRKRSLYFDLDQNTPRLVSEISDTDQLCNPEHFVETSFKLTYFDQFAVKRSIESTELGNLVLMKENE